MRMKFSTEMDYSLEQRTDYFYPKTCDARIEKVSDNNDNR